MSENKFFGMSIYLFFLLYMSENKFLEMGIYLWTERTFVLRVSQNNCDICARHIFLNLTKFVENITNICILK